MKFKLGDFAICRKQKHSVHASPHAKGISPAAQGDFYSYYVDRFWTVIPVTDTSGMLCISPVTCN